MNNRLNRLEFLYDENPVYFITANISGRRHLLDNQATHQVFVHFCKEARNYGVLVGKYVLMPNHLHLFACFPPGAVGLSQWMKSLKNSLSKHWRSEGIEAPHWQKGFFDHLLRSHESHAEKWKYVAENPVRAGLCKAVADWPYAGQIMPSSYY
jgi:putative transposase